MTSQGDESGDEKSAKRRWENVTSLVHWIESVDVDQADDEGLSDIISQVVLNDILHRQREISAQEQHESGRSQLALIRAGLSSECNA